MVRNTVEAGKDRELLADVQAASLRRLWQVLLGDQQLPEYVRQAAARRLLAAARACEIGLAGADLGLLRRLSGNF
jgi:hypothetical protein